MQRRFYTAAKQGASPLSLNNQHLLVVTDIATRGMGNNITICYSKTKVNCGIFGKGLVSCQLPSVTIKTLLNFIIFCHTSDKLDNKMY